MSLFNELKRRNVFRVGIAYLVAAWLIMQVADVILNNIEAPDWIFPVILMVLGIGFPVILMFAWAFEMTPEGIKRENEVDRSHSITPQTGKKLDRVIIGVLTIALLYFAVDKFVLSPAGRESAQLAGQAGDAGTEQVAAKEQDGKSIAVLPMANRSAREEDQFFIDGIHDDLLTQLAKIADLKVISRTSVMRYRNTELSIPEIAAQLGVATILEGGIQRAGDQVRINVQLIEAETDEHLWAETYDRRLTVENLFSIQSEITRNITAALRATLTDEEAARIDAPPTENLEALQEYMRGQQLLALRNVESIEQGKLHFERALELDPRFAPAMAGLANAYHLLYEYDNAPEEQTIIPAMGWLSRALDIDPDLGEAYVVRGELYRHLEDFEAAEADFRKALQLSPNNATALHWFSNLRGQQGFEEEGLALLRKAHELDPMSRIIHVNLAMAPFRSGDDEAALAELERVQALHPDFYVAYLYEGWISTAHGDMLGALRSHLKVVELDPRTNRNGFHCFDYYSLGALEAAQRCVDDTRGISDGWMAYVQILLALDQGDRERAMAMFDAAVAMEGEASWKEAAAVTLGRYEVARAIYREEFPGWFSEEEIGRLDADDLNDAIDVAAILQADGEAEKATVLLRAALDTMAGLHRNRGMDFYGFGDVAAHALLGNRESALQALEQCADIPFLTDWPTLTFHPVFDSIRDDPRFSAAVRKLEAAAADARRQAVEEGLL